MSDRSPFPVTSGPADPDWLRVVQDLLSALEDEHRALTRNDIEALESATRAKQALVAQLGAIDARRCVATDPNLKSVVEQCRRLNEKNGAIVTARMHLTQRSLAILRGETEPGLYGPGGDTLDAGGGRSIARA